MFSLFGLGELRFPFNINSVVENRLSASTGEALTVFLMMTEYATEV